MFHQDYIMRQIEMLTEAIASYIFNKETAIHYEIRDEIRQVETDILYLQLRNLLNDNKINEAENLLFEMIDPLEANHFIIAVDFYEKVNKLSDVELKEYDFSKDEIIDGLNRINKLFITCTNNNHLAEN